MQIISNQNIAEAIYLALENKKDEEISDITNKIVHFLIRKRFISRVNDILDRLKNIFHKKEGKIVAKISSREQLNEEVKEQLIFYLRERYKMKNVLLESEINKELLGGFKIEINNEIIDLTIKNKLENLEEYLIKKYE